MKDRPPFHRATKKRRNMAMTMGTITDMVMDTITIITTTTMRMKMMMRRRWSTSSES